MNIEKRKVWARRGENNKCKAGKKVLIFLKHSVNFVLQCLFSPLCLFLPPQKKILFLFHFHILFILPFNPSFPSSSKKSQNTSIFNPLIFSHTLSHSEFSYL